MDESRILVIDDDAQVRFLFRTILERAGYEVDEAEDGASGLQHYADYPADLVITDIVMPEIEGIEVILQLRRIHPDVRIIAISGGGRGNPFTYLAMAKHLGADHVLAKPVNPKELVVAVAGLLSGPENAHK